MRWGAVAPPVATVVRALKPLNASAPWPLPPPAPLSCAELRNVAKPYRRHMPAELRPARRC